jgi:hypothetical protein
VDLTDFSDNDGPKSSVVLTGAIGDYGVATRETSGGSNVQQELSVSLTRGSFVLNVSGIESKLEREIDDGFPTNESTCSGLITVQGSSPVVAGSGRGAYVNLQGRFNLTVAINEVQIWPTCPRTDAAAYLAESVFISGSGSVSLR